ncbi:MAG TPA: hypothetical protein VHA73_06405 [Acidimicrobiales bacterium]|jgi:hypothetical protein|nr:hypothetical protein [Acidimicrobiales bacterium]
MRRAAAVVLGLLAVAAAPACSSGNKADPRAFCAATDRARQLGAEIQSSSLDNRPVVQQKIHAAATAANHAADQAPSTIRQPARQLAEALSEFDHRAAAATDSESLTRAFTNYTDRAANLTRQSQQVEAWVQSNCAGAGSGPSVTSATSAPTSSATTSPTSFP